MRRFLSLLLTLCMLFTVVAVSTVTVSAAEGTDTVLFKLGDQIVAAQQDFSQWDTNLSDEENSAIGGTGVFTQYDTNITSTMTDTNLVKTVNEDGSYSISIQRVNAPAGRYAYYKFTNDDSVSTANVQKAVYTFKVLGKCFQTSDPKTSLSLGTKAYLAFDTYATIGGASKKIRAFWLTSGNYPSRGTGAGANDYSEMNTTNFVTGEDGYYNVRIEVYKSSDGYIYSDVYNANTNVKCGYHKYAYTDGDTIGEYFYLSVVTSKDAGDATLEAYIKDLKTTLIYENTGSVVATESVLNPVYDYADKTISVTPGIGGTSDCSLQFTSDEEIETGNIVVDFKLKTEQSFYTDNPTQLDSNYRKFNITGNSKASDVTQYNPSGLTMGRIQNANFYIGAKGNNYTTATLASALGEWVPLRMVISRTDPSKGWSVACYNLKTSETSPVWISYAQDIGNFSAFSFRWYRPKDIRGASTTDSTLPVVQQPITVKDLVITKTDTITNASMYGYYGSGLGNSNIRIVDNSYVFSDTIYVRSQADQSPKAYFVVKDAEGKEVGHQEADLVDGINYPVNLTVAGLESPSTCTAKLYVFDGENWLDGEEYVPAPAPSTAIDTVSVQSQIDDSTAVMRFIFKPTFDGTVTKFGAYIIPYDLFTNESATVENVYNDGSIASESSYSVDLVKIPQTAYGRGIIALPYIVVNGETFQADATSAQTVNATKLN